MSYDNFFQLFAEQKPIEMSPDHWWVTTKFVYYKLTTIHWKVTRSLVSYDLLPHAKCWFSSKIERSPDHWWVTTRFFHTERDFPMIERSPDHWWVTTKPNKPYKGFFGLKGHQIIGELRLPLVIVRRSPWRLKGHQIIGELRPEIGLRASKLSNWKVTRSLVSYDFT